MWISHATHDINPPRSRNTLLKLLFENPFHDLKSLFLSLSSNVSGLTHLRLGCLESFKCRCYSVDCELTRRSAHECAEEPMEVHEQSLDWDQVAVGELARARNLLPTHSGWLCASTAAVRPILPFALRKFNGRVSLERIKQAFSRRGRYELASNPTASGSSVSGILRTTSCRRHSSSKVRTYAIARQVKSSKKILSTAEFLAYWISFSLGLPSLPHSLTEKMVERKILPCPARGASPSR